MEGVQVTQGESAGNSSDGSFAVASPTFEDLAIDDSLSDLQRITTYVQSHIALQRLVHVKMLGDVAKSIGYTQTCSEIIPLLETLASDPEFVIRQHVAMQFPILSTVIVKDNAGVEGYNILVNKLLPQISKLVSDIHAEVRSEASSSFIQIARLVPQEDHLQYVLFSVLELAHDDEDEELRITAVLLLTDLAEQLGTDLVHQFVVPELISLSEDPIFRVRKATALNFSKVCVVASEESVLERLLPVFVSLTRDEIWGVRKACAESLVDLTLAIKQVDTRVSKLIPAFYEFMQDESKWVRFAALEVLGKFISTIPASAVDAELLEHFTSVALEDSVTDQNIRLKYLYAYNFPAVVQTLGRERWPELLQSFLNMTKDTGVLVKRPLSFGMHEIAKIIGKDFTESHLLHPFEEFLTSGEDLVKIGVVTHAAAFLEVVSSTVRSDYLKTLDTVCFSSAWRFRLALCNQLPSLVSLFTETEVEETLVPMTLKLLVDDVAAVRTACCDTLPRVFVSLSITSPVLKTLVAGVKELATNDSCIMRQTFVQVCHALYYHEENSREIFQKQFANEFIKTGLDRVSCVRMYVAKVLADPDLPEWLISNNSTKGTVIGLSQDTNADIKSLYERFSPLLRSYCSNAENLENAKDDAGDDNSAKLVNDDVATTSVVVPPPAPVPTATTIKEEGEKK